MIGVHFRILSKWIRTQKLWPQGKYATLLPCPLNECVKLNVLKIIIEHPQLLYVLPLSLFGSHAMTQFYVKFLYIEIVVNKSLTILLKY